MPARTLTAEEYGSAATIPHADVLIVGAGPSGATVAKHLSEWGFDVVCLEQGPWINTDEYTGARDEFELTANGRWHHDENVRQLPEDYPVEVTDSDVIPVMYNGVGGGTIHYGAQFPRHLPSDFRVKTLDGIADDWPITYDELVPYYDQIDRDFAVAGLADDPAYPPGWRPPLPAHPVNEYGQRFITGMDKLGWHWWPAPNAIASQNHEDLVPCVRYGVCEQGCPNGSKASVDITHWGARAMGKNTTIVTRARVAKITVDDNGRATGAVFLDAAGNEHHQSADRVVLAANGIGTARLLLLSASVQHPNGLANSSGLVGRNLMLHPTSLIVGLYEEPMNTWVGPAGQPVHSLQFYESDPTRGHLRGGKWQIMPTGGPFFSATLSALRRGGLVTGTELHDEVEKIFRRSLLLTIVTEDLPHEENRVELDPHLTDSSGIPAPKIFYRRDENSIALVKWHVEKGKEALAASGCTDFLVEEVLPDQPGHLLGTARMGTDPTRSVVDPFGRSHDVDNLWIVDGSVFVTSGGVNPTNTIAALALRSAEAIVRVAQEELEE
jgi:choline dehydrogenase-like flavoprotein